MDAHAQFRKGLTGIVGIWLTMAMMPLAELLPLTAWQLLIVRGAPGAAVFGVVILLQKGTIELPDLNMILTAVAFMLACVGLFNAILAWGTNLSAVMLDMAVLVNFCFAVWHKKLVARASVVLFITAIIGSYLALRGWDVPNLNIAGLLWSLLALVANGLVIEFGAKTKQDSKVRVFWMSAALIQKTRTFESCLVFAPNSMTSPLATSANRLQSNPAILRLGTSHPRNARYEPMMAVINRTTEARAAGFLCQTAKQKFTNTAMSSITALKFVPHASMALKSPTHASMNATAVSIKLRSGSSMLPFCSRITTPNTAAPGAPRTIRSCQAVSGSSSASGIIAMVSQMPTMPVSPLRNCACASMYPSLFKENV